MEDKFKKIQQTAVHYGEDYEKFLGAVVPPIFENSLFRFPDFETYEASLKEPGSRYAYTRGENPTCRMAEEKIAQMENGETAKTFVSGTSAIFSALSAFLRKDDHIVYVKSTYGRVELFLKNYFSRFGVQYTKVEGDDIEEFKAAIKSNTRVIYLESPSSLIFKLQDLKTVAGLAKANGIYTIIDNTWATPVFQNPLDFGIDIVVHSVSKYLGGHSDIIGGVMVANRAVMDKVPAVGSFLPPFEAWLLIRGLRTLGIRMRQHQDSALAITRYLSKHPKVLKVNYPGLGKFPQHQLAMEQMKGFSGVFSMEIDTDKEGIKRFINSLKYFALGASWGGFESIVSALIAGRSEQEVIELGYSPGLVRLSIGLENVDCLLEDVEYALKKV